MKLRALTPKFLRYERRLRREVPCVGPVVVYMRRNMIAEEDCVGCAFAAVETKAKREKLVVHIAAEMTEREAIDTLIHEFAHALAWGKEREEHGIAWGKAYSRCYRVAVEGLKRPKPRKPKKRRK